MRGRTSRGQQLELPATPGPNSSTNFLQPPISPITPKNLDSFRGDSFPSSSIGMITKQIRIGVGQQQSALPPSDRDYSFANLVPLVLFSVMTQLHVIYLVLISGFLLLKDCEINGALMIVQLSLTLAYIGIEITNRFLTFRFYTQQPVYNDAYYYWWNTQAKNWEKIQQADIRVGQIIKVKKKLQQQLEEPLQVDESLQAYKVRVPVNMLPIRVGSGEKYISIETFDTDKQEGAIRVPLIHYFEQYITVGPNNADITVGPNNADITIRSKISDQCLIEYTFTNPVSQSFQANICFLGQGYEKRISNEDAIPRGAYFCNENQLIGLVLYNLEQKRTADLKHILGSKNGIVNFHSFVRHRGIQYCVLAAIAGHQCDHLRTSIKIGTTFHNLFHCYFFNYMGLMYFASNVVMYILLGIHQIIDSFLIKRKCNVKMNNYIKSIDQFGVVDTFVMDEFTFITKNILQVSQIDINQQPATSIFDEETILIVIEKSGEFEAKYQNQWLALNHYYRSKYGRGSEQRRGQIVVINEKIDISGCIVMVVGFEEKGSRFVVRFSERVIFSVLDSVDMQKRPAFEEKIKQGKDNGELILMIEITEAKNEYIMDISRAMYEPEFKFLSLVRLKFLPRSKAMDFLRYLKNKYKVFIMTSSRFEYFDKVMVSGNLKTQRDTVMILEQIEENDLQRELEEKLEQHKRQKQKQKVSKEEQAIMRLGSEDSEQKRTQKWRNTTNSININMNERVDISTISSSNSNLIIALHSSLIVYLSRPTIRNLLQQLSKYSTYVIFYNCTQFQKQLCAASIFKSFPEHIFLSNFAIDVNIFRISNLSMCIERHSAQRYVTATAQSYNSLQKFISKECVTSIELTTIIIKTHVFKNQCLIWSLLTATILVYQGTYMYTLQQYSPFIMYLFNVAFTILPIFYYLIARPEPIGDIMVQDYKDYKLRYETMKGILCGVLVTYISYAIIPEQQIELVFVAVMIDCTFMANLYHLVLDDSADKKPQIWWIVVQSVLSIGVYFLTLFVNTSYNLFVDRLELSPHTQTRVLFFCCVFVLNLLVVLIAFFFMSFHRSIHTKDQRELKKMLENQKIRQSAKKQYTVAKVQKSSGKQMKFRAVDSRIYDSKF